jgi:hypothetical protein
MRFSQHLAVSKLWRSWYRPVMAAVSTALVSLHTGSLPARSQEKAYCQSSLEEVTEIDNLRQAAFKGNGEDQKRYSSLVAKRAELLQECRQRTWPQTQAIWLRLYPCDVQPGVLDGVLDRIVARGYNHVYVEYFYDGQVLLPEAENRSVWPSAVRVQEAKNTDLLAQAIQKGRERGLKVYAWLFTMNFGYTYGQRPDRQQAIARKANGQTSFSNLKTDDAETDIKAAEGDVSKVFIDPYNPQARQDYLWVVNAALQRRPDGVLFDYVRYPRGAGPESVVSKVHDLWLYSAATQQSLLQRAGNQKGRELIRRYLSQGFISTRDVEAVNKLYPTEAQPLWQGRRVDASKTVSSVSQLQADLWYFSVAHVVQGIIDFVNLAAAPVQQQGIPAGAVFFPGGNKSVGHGGFDSRLQPWDRFPSSMEWHPMAYGNCGSNNTRCIVEEIQRVLSMAPPGTQVIPALAGTWGGSLKNRPPLEAQMEAIRRAFPQINGVSHFAYSWQEPEADRDRKFCDPR